MSIMSCYFCGGKECKYENWKNWLVPPYINACAGVEIVIHLVYADRCFLHVDNGWDNGIAKTKH